MREEILKEDRPEKEDAFQGQDHVADILGLTGIDQIIIEDVRALVLTAVLAAIAVMIESDAEEKVRVGIEEEGVIIEKNEKGVQKVEKEEEVQGIRGIFLLQHKKLK